MKTFTFLIIGVSLVSLPAMATEKVTLDQAVNQALSKNPTIQIAKEKITELDSQVSQTRSQVFPVVNGALGLLRKKDAVNLGNPLFGGEPYNQYSFGFSANQPIYRGGAVSAALEVAKKEKAIRQLDLEIAERDLTMKVLSSFLSALVQNRRIETLEQQRNVVADLLRTAERREHSGLSQRLEVLQLRTQLALIDPQIAKAKNQLQISAMELANLIGMADVRELSLVGDLGRVPWKEFDEIERRKNGGRFIELIKNELVRDQLDEKKGVQMGRHLPQVDLIGNWGRGAFVKSDLLDEFSTAWNFGLQVSIPIFSGLSSVHERNVFASQIVQLDQQRKQLFDSLSLDQVKAQKELELARTQVDASEKAFKYSSESQAEARRTYRLGTSSYLQLYESEQKYVEAAFSFDQARYDALMAMARYMTASGLSLQEFVNLLSQRT